MSSIKEEQKYLTDSINSFLEKLQQLQELSDEEIKFKKQYPNINYCISYNYNSKRYTKQDFFSCEEFPQDAKINFEIKNNFLHKKSLSLKKMFISSVSTVVFDVNHNLHIDRFYSMIDSNHNHFGYISKFNNPREQKVVFSLKDPIKTFKIKDKNFIEKYEEIMKFNIVKFAIYCANKQINFDIDKNSYLYDYAQENILKQRAFNIFR